MTPVRLRTRLSSRSSNIAPIVAPQDGDETENHRGHPPEKRSRRTVAEPNGSGRLPHLPRRLFPRDVSTPRYVNRNRIETTSVVISRSMSHRSGRRILTARRGRSRIEFWEEQQDQVAGSARRAPTSKRITPGPRPIPFPPVPVVSCRCRAHTYANGRARGNRRQHAVTARKRREPSAMRGASSTQRQKPSS